MRMKPDRVFFANLKSHLLFKNLPVDFGWRFLSFDQLGCGGIGGVALSDTVDRRDPEFILGVGFQLFNHPSEELSGLDRRTLVPFGAFRLRPVLYLRAGE